MNIISTFYSLNNTLYTRSMLQNIKKYIKISNSWRAPPIIKIVEVGLRDGIQNVPTFISTHDKLELAKNLIQSNIKFLEVSSYVSPKWVPQMKDHRELVRTIKKHDMDRSYQNKYRTSVIVPNMNGLIPAIEDNVDEVTLLASADQTFAKKNLNKTSVELLSINRKMCEYLKYNSPKTHIRAVISCIFEDPFTKKQVLPHDVYYMAKELFKMGCEEVSLADTTGVGSPGNVQELLNYFHKKKLSFNIPFDKLGFHLHNTYGLALPNILMAIENGVYTFDTSIAGLGGCPFALGSTGNVATEDVVYMLHGCGFNTNIDLDMLYKASLVFCAGAGLKNNSAYTVARRNGSLQGLKHD